jgi:hypothetical protein
MAVPHSATFTFNGIAATVTGVQVETPVAEIVDMTGLGDASGYTVQVATGDIRGGSVPPTRSSGGRSSRARA